MYKKKTKTDSTWQNLHGLKPTRIFNMTSEIDHDHFRRVQMIRNLQFSSQKQEEKTNQCVLHLHLTMICYNYIITPTFMYGYRYYI